VIGRVAGAVVAFACSVAGAVSGAAGTDLARLLPPPGFASGWEPAGPPMRFHGADLYNHVDGAAEVFLELGFDHVLVQDYAHGGDELTVELYAMRDDVAAAGVYLMKRGAGGRDAAVPGRHAFTPRQIVSYRGDVLVIVTNGTGTGAVDAMRAAAAAVLRALPPERPAPLAGILPSDDMVEGTLRYIRGPFTLERVVTLGRGDVLQLAGRTTAVAADYRDGDATFTLVSAIYPDAEAAASALAYLRAHLDPYLAPLRSDADLLVFREGADGYGEARRTGARIDLRVHLSHPPSTEMPATPAAASPPR
jgi:hypothetical protein